MADLDDLDYRQRVAHLLGTMQWLNDRQARRSLERKHALFTDPRWWPLSLAAVREIRYEYDRAKALGKRLPGQEDLRREVSDALRQNREALQALQAALTRLGAPRLFHITGDVSGSIIITGDGNQVPVPDRGLLAQRWQELQFSDAEAADLYRERIATCIRCISSPCTASLLPPC